MMKAQTCGSSQNIICPVSFVGYGLTEAIVTHMCYGNDPNQWPKGSSGTLVPNAEAKVKVIATSDCIVVSFQYLQE